MADYGDTAQRLRWLVTLTGIVFLLSGLVIGSLVARTITLHECGVYHERR